jgi:nitric oxide reductase subunit B
VENPQLQRRERLISRGWVQAVALVALFGFSSLGYIAARTYQAEPPIPGRVVSPTGELVFTGEDVRGGQEVFLRNGIMEYGSIFGHGAYLGPDFTADYLHRAAVDVAQNYAGSGGDAYHRTVADFHANLYDPGSGTLAYSAARTAAHRRLERHYHEFFADPEGGHGLRPAAIADPEDTRRLAAYFAWSAWVATARRPGEDYSYTNNWPPEALVDNRPSADILVWSVLSLIALLAGIGAALAAFGRWDWLGWHGSEQHRLSFRPPDTVALTPSQKATAGYFLVMSALFLLQVVLGALTQHYRTELGGVFGLRVDHLLPYNVARTWHVQLSIFWVVTSFLAAGVFLAPLISGHREPRGQHVLTYLLLGALAVVVFGSLLGELAGIHGWFGDLWLWFGMQGFEYLDLGRFWQVLLIGGLFFWVAILWRSLRRRLAAEHAANMPWLFFFAALALPAWYAVGLLAHPRASFVVADFWRFIVVHLWVEDFLELFTTVMVAYMFVLLGVVRERVAVGVIFVDIVLYSAGGVIGTAHHLYFNGSPAEVLALGAFFSAMEVIPLTLLTAEAWKFIQLGGQQEARSPTPFPHRWAVLFLVAVGFWNFVGAGVFGFLVNLPIVSYYEIGTALTANHAHAAMMGVYGMLAVGFMLFCLRYLIPQDRWSDRLARISFWSLNLGLAWMAFVTLLPLGVLQLHRSVSAGYHAARDLAFITADASWWLEVLAPPGRPPLHRRRRAPPGLARAPRRPSSRRAPGRPRGRRPAPVHRAGARRSGGPDLSPRPRYTAINAPRPEYAVLPERRGLAAHPRLRGRRRRRLDRGPRLWAPPAYPSSSAADRISVDRRRRRARGQGRRADRVRPMWTRRIAGRRRAVSHDRRVRRDDATGGPAPRSQHPPGGVGPRRGARRSAALRDAGARGGSRDRGRRPRDHPARAPSSRRTTRSCARAGRVPAGARGRVSVASPATPRCTAWPACIGYHGAGHAGTKHRADAPRVARARRDRREVAVGRDDGAARHDARARRRPDEYGALLHRNLPASRAACSWPPPWRCSDGATAFACGGRVSWSSASSPGRSAASSVSVRSEDPPRRDQRARPGSAVDVGGGDGFGHAESVRASRASRASRAAFMPSRMSEGPGVAQPVDRGQASAARTGACAQRRGRRRTTEPCGVERLRANGDRRA